MTERIHPKTTTRIYFCYLLESQNECYRNATYIGFTNNVLRRIRQHNGEMKAGAKRTSVKRPWQIVCTVYGFPTKIAALQFEWAWQNPRTSRLVKAVANARSFQRGSLGRIQEMLEMLHMLPWTNYPLHVRFATRQHFDFSISKGAKVPPPHIDVTQGPIEELECFGTAGGLCCSDDDDESDDSEVEMQQIDYAQLTMTASDDTEVKGEMKTCRSASKSDVQKLSRCDLCANYSGSAAVEAVMRQTCTISVTCTYCSNGYHVTCLARLFALAGGCVRDDLGPVLPSSATLIPRVGSCPGCKRELSWASIVERVRHQKLTLCPLDQSLSSVETSVDAALDNYSFRPLIEAIAVKHGGHLGSKRPKHSDAP